MCVCVCERERERNRQGERERETDRQGEREREVGMGVQWRVCEVNTFGNRVEKGLCS